MTKDQAMIHVLIKEINELKFEIGRLRNNSIIIPENATNGDIIKAMFPHIEISDNCKEYYSVNIEDLEKDKAFNTIGFKKGWWNAPYKGGKQE